MEAPLFDRWLEEARRIVGPEHLLVETRVLEPYAHDEFALETCSRLPLAVVKPGGEEEIGAIVRLCAALGVPLTARGGGTGLSGGCVPAPGGIVLSLERLNRVLDADRTNHTLTVEAGVPLGRLYQEVDRMGLYFPPHPGDEGAFIGGAVAANAGGARAVKYGTVRRFVRGLRVVLADGRVADLGGKILKSSTGYDLLDLMIGSEGTLGIITRVTVSLLPRPGAVQTLVAPFDTIRRAIRAVPTLMDRGILPGAVEFVEHSVIRCAERRLERRWPARAGSASLLFILDGRTGEEVESLAESLGAVLEEAGALDVLVADSPQQQEELLQMRSQLYEVLRPGTAELFDICVPRSGIADHVELVHELEDRHGLPLPSYGHAADGNIHTHAMRQELHDGLLGAEVPGWREKHEAVRDALFADAVRRGGVISGEHGIGLVKRDFLESNLGAVNVELMRAVKSALDPRGILNPDKVL